VKEREMRAWVDNFIAQTVRKALIPASMGIGLALAGCDSSEPLTQSDAQSDVSGDAGANPDQDMTPAPLYAAQMPDSGMATKYMAQLPDSGGDTSPAPRYMAQMPDSGTTG